MFEFTTTSIIIIVCCAAGIILLLILYMYLNRKGKENQGEDAFIFAVNKEENDENTATQEKADTLHSAESALQETEGALQTAESGLQETEGALQTAESGLQETEDALQTAESALRNGADTRQPAEASLREMPDTLPSTDPVPQETEGAALQEDALQIVEDALRAEDTVRARQAADSLQEQGAQAFAETEEQKTPRQPGRLSRRIGRGQPDLSVFYDEIDEEDYEQVGEEVADAIASAFEKAIRPADEAAAIRDTAAASLDTGAIADTSTITDTGVPAEDAAGIQSAAAGHRGIRGRVASERNGHGDAKTETRDGAARTAAPRSVRNRASNIDS